MGFTTWIGVVRLQSVFCHTDWGGPVDLKSKGIRGPAGFESAVGAWGVGGVNSQLANKTLRLRIYGYMAK